METTNQQKRKKTVFFEKFANKATQVTGSTGAFFLALACVVVWAATGPLFNFSENWQLVINTGTTIITFLMVFMIQKSQNKDSLAVQLKLNELVASNQLASNRLVDVESLTEEELRVIRKYYHVLSELAKKEKDIHQSHSFDEAKERHVAKQQQQKPKKKE